MESRVLLVLVAGEALYECFPCFGGFAFFSLFVEGLSCCGSCGVDELVVEGVEVGVCFVGGGVAAAGGGGLVLLSLPGC